MKWARYNVGADSPEQYGEYFAYGENRTKDSYDKYNYAYGYTDENRNYYCTFLGNISGNGAYDAATAKWGGYARMPTKAECEELITSCTWENTTYNGVNGKKVTGPNGNSIFIPAAGERNVSEEHSFNLFTSGIAVRGFLHPVYRKNYRYITNA